MTASINAEPRLFADSSAGLDDDAETMARINRLRSLQDRISRRPGVYQKALLDLGTEATSLTLDIHDDEVATRDVTNDPKKSIKEYFAKRDDGEVVLDAESERAIYGAKKFKELAETSGKKRSILRKTGVMKSERIENPESREASNAVRRYILGEYIGRVVLWEAQKEPKKAKRAG